jgi:hypothetical protein
MYTNSINLRIVQLHRAVHPLTLLLVWKLINLGELLPPRAVQALTPAATDRVRGQLSRNCLSVRPLHSWEVRKSIIQNTPIFGRVTPATKGLILVKATD